LSAGRDNAGNHPVEAASRSKDGLMAVGIGIAPEADTAAEQDLAIVSVSHDQRVTVGHRAQSGVTGESRGFEARTVPIELLLDDQVVARSSAALSPDRPQREVNMSVEPSRAGQVVYTLRIPVDPAET